MNNIEIVTIIKPEIEWVELNYTLNDVNSSGFFCRDKKGKWGIGREPGLPLSQKYSDELEKVYQAYEGEK